MIDDGTDRPGHALKTLVAQALRGYKTSALFPFLETKDVVVRSAAARQLQIRGGAAVLKRIEPLLEDERPHLRELASFILGQLGTPRLPFRKRRISALVRHLEAEREPEVIAAGLIALGHLRASEVVKGLLRFRRHRSSEVREAVAYLIGMTGNQRTGVSSQSGRTLRALKRDEERRVRSAARFAEELLQAAKC
jgi:HEAT repeat protein